MRKKAHLSLASYILHSDGFEPLLKHKKAFYVGSILPDCIPSFITRRHNINETFQIVQKKIRKLTDDLKAGKKIRTKQARNLGEITHYIADYFTFPHNAEYSEGFKAHCSYEGKQKKIIRDYLKTDDAKLARENKWINFLSMSDIWHFIEEKHDEYTKLEKNIKLDIKYITEVNHHVADAILARIEDRIHM